MKYIADTKKREELYNIAKIKNIYYQVITMSKNLSFLGIHIIIIIISAQKNRKKIKKKIHFRSVNM